MDTPIAPGSTDHRMAKRMRRGDSALGGIMDRMKPHSAYNVARDGLGPEEERLLSDRLAELRMRMQPGDPERFEAKCQLTVRHRLQKELNLLLEVARVYEHAINNQELFEGNQPLFNEIDAKVQSYLVKYLAMRHKKNANQLSLDEPGSSRGFSDLVRASAG